MKSTGPSSDKRFVNLVNGEPKSGVGKRESWAEAWAENFRNIRVRCSRCLFDEKTPSITFDRDGVCNYCRMHDQLESEYCGGEGGSAKLGLIVDTMKSEGRGKPFDVVVGVSGGCDSSYLIHLSKELGLRPLAVHFDNTWDSTIAVENIHNVLKRLGVELFTYVVDNEEYDDIYRSFLKAGVPDLEANTDIGLAATLFMAAEKYKVKYIFEGHSFRTEGLSPLGWLYMDGKYISEVQRIHGTKKLKSFPNLWLSSQLKWMILRRIRKIRPLWYIDYKKEEVKRMLADTYGWQWYGGHHLENRFTSFYHTYFLPRRFGFDTRMNGFSAMIRSGQMSREAGLKIIAEPPDFDPDLVEMVKKRLGLTDELFETYMTQPKRTYTEYRTYKRTFERMRPFFWLMAEMNLIPKSFYIKYTSKKNI